MSVVLRRWEADDAAFYAGAVRDASIRRFTTEPEVTIEQATLAIRMAPDAGAYAIADADTGEPMGNIGWKRVAGSDAVEGYYWVAAEHRGRGVARQALELLWDAAVAAGHERMCLVVARDNEASCRTAFAAGFVARVTHADSVTFERSS